MYLLKSWNPSQKKVIVIYDSLQHLCVFFFKLSITSTAVQKKFKERYPHDYAEGMSDMFNALAANWLGNLVRVKETPGSSTPQDEVQCISKVVEYLKKADDSMRGVNDYTYIIKGFFEMRQGDFKRAEDHFRVVKDRASSKIQQKRKFLFGAIMGMVFLVYVFLYAVIYPFFFLGNGKFCSR